MKKNVEKDFSWLKHSNKCPKANTCSEYDSLKCSMFKNHQSCSHFKLTELPVKKPV